jgi:hypothetical protein
LIDFPFHKPTAAKFNEMKYLNGVKLFDTMNLKVFGKIWANKKLINYDFCDDLTSSSARYHVLQKFKPTTKR